MPKLEFFIERRGGAYVLIDANGELHLSTRFPDEASAAEPAIQNALYALSY